MELPLFEGLRHYFRGCGGGVWIITTLNADGVPVGFTASSVASVSLEPPMVVFSLQAGSSSWPAVEHTRRVCIHALGESNEHLARQFATRGADRFAGIDWHEGPSGLPLLTGVNGHLVAEIRQIIPVGESRLMLAEATQVDVSDMAGLPLMHTQRAYWKPVKLSNCS